MGIKERKEREKDEHRELILSAAGEIIKKEGIENLSIRKIAASIEYSPGIIYHYFHNKEEIINLLVKDGYDKMLDTLSSEETYIDNPVKRLDHLLRAYINITLQMPEEYKTILLSSSDEVLQHTSTLFQGAASQRKALGMLAQCLKDIYKNKRLDDNIIELTTQVIWTSVFGLIIRIIIEKNICEEQRNNLIEHHIKLVVNGMVLGKSLIDL